MSTPELRIEWDFAGHGEQVPVQSHARTWASLAIHIGDVCATRVADLKTRSIRAAVRVPLMPLAEWIVSNWWFVLHESPHLHPIPGARYVGGPARAWFRRHNLLFAREGFPLPDLTLARADESYAVARLVPDPRPVGRYPVRFTEECDVLVARSNLREQLHALVEAVLEQLEGCTADDAVELREAWSALQSQTGDDRLLRVRAAALGLDGDDPEQVTDPMARALVSELSTLPDSVVSDLLEVRFDVSAVDAHVEWLQRLRGRAEHESLRAPSVDVERARREVSAIRTSAPMMPAYRTGWDLAGRARETIFHLDPMAHGSKVDAQLGAWMARAAEKDAGPPSLRGWVAADDAVTLALRSADQATERWISSRAFCLVLLGGRERLVTDAQSWSQSVCRAFATELLAPVAFLRQRVRADTVSDAELHELADELCAPRRAVEHQLQNHGIAVVVD